MEWTLAGLFAISALLLIVSMLRSARTAKKERDQIDQIHISILEEINSLQKTIRNLELDQEVFMYEARIPMTYEEKVFMREVLDMYYRKYSVESIAELKKVTPNTIEKMLAPYQKVKDERRKVANES